MLYSAICFFTLVGFGCLLLMVGTGKDAPWWKDTAKELGMEFRKSGATKSLHGVVDNVNVDVDKKNFDPGGSSATYLRIAVESEFSDGLIFTTRKAHPFESLVNQVAYGTVSIGHTEFDEKVRLMGEWDEELIRVVFNSDVRKRILDVLENTPLELEMSSGHFYGLLNQKKATSKNLPQAIRDTVEISKKLDLAYYPYRTRSP